MVKAALIRFARVVGGQALGAGITAAIANYTALPGLDTPGGLIIGATLGAALVAADKYLREKGVYGG